MRTSREVGQAMRSAVLYTLPMLLMDWIGLKEDSHGRWAMGGVR